MHSCIYDHAFRLRVGDFVQADHLDVTLDFTVRVRDRRVDVFLAGPHGPIRGTARCHPDDDFDVALGRDLALCRAMERLAVAQTDAVHHDIEEKCAQKALVRQLEAKLARVEQLNAESRAAQQRLLPRRRRTFREWFGL